MSEGKGEGVDLGEYRGVEGEWERMLEGCMESETKQPQKKTNKH